MHGNRAEVFVIMPFADEFSTGYRDVIKPGIEAAGLSAVRGDQEALGHIHTAIFERIFDAPILVADISGANPNVFYELGIAHSISCKTITVCREDYIGRVPFDIGPYRILVYPKPPDANGDNAAATLYAGRVQEAVGKLAEALRPLPEDGFLKIANPVQDYLASRSPFTCTTSQYLDSFGRGDEEEILGKAKNEIVYVALSGASFAGILVGYLEANRRSAPLDIKLATLSTDYRDGWRFIFQLRESRAPSEDELDEFITEEKVSQAKIRRTAQRLTKQSEHAIVAISYSAIPLFWAYWIDRKRLIMGHLAQNRTSARHLPVMVLLQDDPRTHTIYRYYAGIIAALLADKPADANPGPP